MTFIVTMDKSVGLRDLIDETFNDIKTTTCEIPMLQLHLILALKVLRGKQQDMIARNIVSFEHFDVDLLFLLALGDNTFKKVWRNLKTPC
jgi:hypothetical protein